ncbi:MAG: inorganic diphosphatase [Bacteroidota bacterium]
MIAELHTLDAIDWAAWEQYIETHGYTIDRPQGRAHPAYPHIIYPMDYGFVNHTRGADGEEVDVFVGTARNGLVGGLLTTDYQKGDTEVKLLYRCSPREIYLANGFINYDRTLMEGTLYLRYPMHTLWGAGKLC